MNKKIGIFMVFVLLVGAAFLSGCGQEAVGRKIAMGNDNVGFDSGPGDLSSGGGGERGLAFGDTTCTSDNRGYWTCTRDCGFTDTSGETVYGSGYARSESSSKAEAKNSCTDSYDRQTWASASS